MHENLVSRKRHAERQSSDWRVVATKKNPIAARLGVLKFCLNFGLYGWAAGCRGMGAAQLALIRLQIRSPASQAN